ncbi:Inactive protein kinase [Nymphaea thermarum]|nr:Inactive protein kinase [Nymphaea thermarum]
MEAVAALQQMGKILGKTDWDFSVDPCSGKSGWTNLRPVKGFENEVGCDCNDTVCHVTRMDLTRNYLSGPIPPEWGSLRLVNLEISFENLTPRKKKLICITQHYTYINNPPHFVFLDHYRSLMSNRLSGPIPEEIGNMISLKNITIENNQFSGELPPHIGNLTNLITNVPGICSEHRVISSNNFTGPLPATLARLTNMTDLILRNSNISGEIPDYIGDMGNLEIMFLTSNQLSGPFPEWIFKTPFKTNLVESYSPATENSLFNILHPFDVLIADSSFHIDCGSKSPTSFEGTTFEKDGVVGAATFFASESEAWAMSSTGVYLDNADVDDDYTATNSSILSIPDAEIYTTARHSPISIKYYGLCLWDGPYTVTLYFAEIMFTDDKNFSSLGKRVFDVYIQDKLVLKDFNIEDAANGSGKAVTRKFSANVTSGVLRIHFFWAGKGTTVVPLRGDYGPLVSAISVDAGRYRSSTFTLPQIQAATRNFHPSNKIGKGGFGPVYKGQLPDGTIVAIKQLASISRQGNREFITEMGMISALQHPNLVKLHGCCIEGNELLLVYEYMENNSLAHALGYMAPEYALHGELTCKADVYSFGVVALEIVSGKSNKRKHSEECMYLLQLVRYFTLLNYPIALTVPSLSIMTLIECAKQSKNRGEKG